MNCFWRILFAKIEGKIVKIANIYIISLNFVAKNIGRWLKILFYISGLQPYVAKSY